MRLRPNRTLPILLLSLSLVPLVALAQSDSPVSVIPSQAFRVGTPNGPALIPLESSQALGRPLPQIRRAIVLIHGLKRNVESAFRTGQGALSAAGAEGRETLVLTPQFLNEEDAVGRLFAANLLRWHGSSWDSGQPAVAPAPVSSFAILDTLVTSLCNRANFPNLTTIVLAGHSAGGQTIQRYAVTGRAQQIAAAAGIHLRFVVANPSSYLYFSDDRPIFTGEQFRSGPFSADNCPQFNRWKYGPLDPPPYVADGAASNWKAAEDAYAASDVIYLLGTSDNDPHHPELDKTCAGEAEGPMRFARGRAYFAYLHARHPSGWNQRLRFVPHVAHSAEEMFQSKCGLASLFDHGQCQDQDTVLASPPA